MMKRYDSYKDSGLEWIREIPEHWDFAKINYYSIIKTGGTPNKERLEYWENGTIKWMSSGEVNKEFVYDVAERITEDGFKNSNATLLPVDTIMIALNGQGKTKGTVAVLKTETTCNQSLAGFICDKKRLNPLYLFYFLKSKYKHLRGLVGDGQREGITLSLLKSLHTPLPPISEQAIVAEFLFNKSSQIDALIQKKQQMIALLEEEKTAVINEAVTKGLNPDVPMKDSGIEWLGMVPAHWEIKKLKYISELISGAAFESGKFTKEGTYKVIKITNIQHDRIDWSDIEYLPDDYAENFQRFKVENEDILFALTRPIISSGIKSAKVELEDEEQVLLNQRNAILRASGFASQNFLYYYTLSHYFFKMFEASIDNTGQQPNISPISIQNFFICLPPVSEQKAIAESISKECKRIENLKSTFIQEINLIQEYRTALISEAVTGKIDVRDYQPEPITYTALA